MAEPTPVTNTQTSFEADTNPDYTVWTDEITDPVNGGLVKKQYIALTDGTNEGTAVVGADAANGLDVDVTRVSGTVTVAGTVDVTELPAAAALGDTDANPTTTQIGSMLQGWTGTVWARLKAGIGDGAGATGFLNIVPMMFNGSTYDRIRGSTAGGLSTQQTGVTLAAGAQVGVTGSAGTLIAANAARRGLTFRSLSANTQSVFIGPATVTLTTGMELKPGETMVYLPGEVPTNLVQAISASGTQTIIIQEAS